VGIVTPGDPLTGLEHRVNEMSADVRDLKAAVYGDGARRLSGLMDQLDLMRQEFVGLRKDLSDLLTWKQQLMFWLKVGVGAVSVTGGASWISVLQTWAGGN
jgi:hypothetical protein